VYKLIEEYEKWREEELKAQEGKELESLVRPCKLTVMRGYVFRQNNPAVVGVDVMEGIVKNGTPLMKEDGKEITTIKSMQLDQENVEKAERGKKVAVSLPNVTVGRQINEGDVLFSAIPEEDFRKLKELKKHLKPVEIKILKEIVVIKRKKNEMWGV
jgi:translation initiation factor 5B